MAGEGAPSLVGYKVVMSADIVGSTALYESLGDAEAREMIAGILDAARRTCLEHHGEVLAEVGDQLLVSFDRPTDAAAAASGIHEYLHAQPPRGGREMRMRIGLHCGALPGGEDALACTTGKIADWAGHNAKPEQTLATRAVIDELPRIFRAVSRYVDDETWNAVSLEHVELYEIIWNVETITAYAGEQTVPRDAQRYTRVVFSYSGDSLNVDAVRPVVSIGRGEHNDLVVRKDLVSRQHLSAQFSRGRCTITDNSTNGSVVIMDDGTRYPLKRESLRLAGSGIIIPGQPPGNEDEFAIRYRCE